MTIVAALLLALPYLAVWHAMSRWLGDWRLGIAGAALAVSAWAVAASELLSLIDAFTQHALMVAWGVPALVSVAYLVRALRHRQWPPATWWTGLSRFERAAGLVVCLCVAVSGLVVLVVDASTWDGLAHQIHRIEAWRQLESVAHDPAHGAVERYGPPGAELFMAQPYVLSEGSTPLVAHVQWLAYVECILIGSLAAGLLGASRRGQFAAAILLATVPIAIVQALDAQDVLVLASKLLIALTLTVAAWRHPRPATLLLMASFSLGLVVLTTNAGSVIALPIGVLIAGVAIRRLGIHRAASLVIAGAVLLALPNIGQWVR